MAGGTGLSANMSGCSSYMSGEDDENANSRKDSTSTAKSESTEYENVTLKVVAIYPINTSKAKEYQRRTLLTTEDITNVSSVREGEGDSLPFLRVRLTEESARRFVKILKENGFTDEGVGGCQWKQNSDDPGWCLLTVVDGAVTYAAGVGQGLASVIDSGEYLNNPTMVVHTDTVESAEELRAAIKNRTDSHPAATPTSDSSSERQGGRND